MIRQSAMRPPWQWAIKNGGRSRMTEPEPLPPPTFWRTRYFALNVLPRRPDLDPVQIRRSVARPEGRRRQPDGRIRLYGWSETLGCYVRVVVLPDGETVHNAFGDESYPP